MKKVIITGATGMVGKGVLLECLDHSDINEVLVIGRNFPDIKHPKLKELIHKNFTDFSDVKNELKGYDACFFCMGIRQAFMFRPGAIIPLRGIKSRTKSYQFMYDYFMWLIKLIKVVE